MPISDGAAAAVAAAKKGAVCRLVGAKILKKVRIAQQEYRHYSDWTKNCALADPVAVKRSPSLQLLGDRIRQARKVKGLSRGPRVGVDPAPSYIGGVERGQRNPSFKKLCAICKIIGRDVGGLLRNLPLADESF